MSGPRPAGIDRDFTELFTDVVAVATRTGSSMAGGKATYGDPTTYTCRVQYKPKQVRTLTGDVRISMAQVIFPQDTGIETHDLITLPDGTSPVILAVGRDPDERGSYLQEVYT